MELLLLKLINDNLYNNKIPQCIPKICLVIIIKRLEPLILFVHLLNLRNDDNLCKN